MFKVNRIQTGLLITALIMAALSTTPLQASIRQPSQPLVTGKNDIYLAISWGDIWKILSRKRNPGGGRGEGICAIAPAKLLDPDSPASSQGEILEVWSDHPLFLWQGEGVGKIELFESGSKEALWKPEIKAGQIKIIYDGEPLKPGQTYEWRLSAPFPIQQPSFQVMEFQKRDRIAKELTALEGRLKGASQETMALEKADYFAQRGLWSDALRELYSVPKPSAELRDAIALLQAYDFCAEDKPNVSASR